MFEILSKPDSDKVIVSIKNNEYVDYKMAEYETIYTGSFRQCELYLETIENN